MADVIDLQGDEPELPEEEKTSHDSYMVCVNSRVSQMMCWRW